MFPDDVSDYVDAVCAAIIVEFTRGQPSMRRIAQLTGVNVRTMRHRLGIRGTSFSRVLRTVRRDAAYTMLQETDMPVSAVAASLGYADPGSFARAFRRWTGLSPGEFRAAGGRAGDWPR